MPGHRPSEQERVRHPLRAFASRMSGRENAAVMVEYVLLAVAIGVAAIAGVQVINAAIGSAVTVHQESVQESPGGGDGAGDGGGPTTTEASTTTEAPTTTTSPSPPTTCVTKGNEGKQFCGP